MPYSLEQAQTNTLPTMGESEGTVRGGGTALIIGGGAAGCFAAVNIKRWHPEMEVVVLEKGTHTMAKLALTGGGRCNITNTFRAVRSMKQAYPRGEKLMKRLLKEFSERDVIEWFEKEGVAFVEQDDECIFPKSQDAMQIVNLLNALMKRLGVKVFTRQNVVEITSDSNGQYIITTENGTSYNAAKVVITTGGKPKQSGLDFLKPLNLRTISPVPSLFTFNINDTGLHELMGCVVDPVRVRLAGTKLEAAGPLLITHWGLSGPAILKLSSYGARLLAEAQYRMSVVVNWLYDKSENDAMEMLEEMRESHPNKLVTSIHPVSDSQTTAMTQKLWQYLTAKADIGADRRWQELGPRQMRRLASILTADTMTTAGRGQYKEEFVTCGGVDLQEIEPTSMMSRRHRGLFFAGEILDIDAITGGFNLQAAWSTAFVAARNIMAALIILLNIPLATAQTATALRSQNLAKWDIAAANYSGITHIDGNRFAIVSDKQTADGFYEWEIEQDSTSGRVTDVKFKTFHANGMKARDSEGIAFCQQRGTIFIAAEDDQEISEYDLQGHPTGMALAIPEMFAKDRIYANYGFEALSYDATTGLFWTCTENTLRSDGPLVGDGNITTATLRLQTFTTDGQPARQYRYVTDSPQGRRKGTMTFGIPALCALGDGTLLVLEREAVVTRRKIGSYCSCRLFHFFPDEGRKELLAEWTTRMNITRRSFANFEGMTLGRRLADGRQTLLLIADSQGGYGNSIARLKDLIRVVIL